MKKNRLVHIFHSVVYHPKSAKPNPEAKCLRMYCGVRLAASTQNNLHHRLIDGIGWNPTNNKLCCPKCLAHPAVQMFILKHTEV